MDEVMRDATSKLTKMKEMLQRQRDGGGGSEAVTRALTERHERDKATALAELEAIKAKYAAREKEMESSHAEKVSLLKVWRRCERMFAVMVVGEIKLACVAAGPS